MNSEGNGEPSLYEVRFSRKTAETAKQLHLEAAMSGNGKEFIAALRQIYQRLQTKPTELGEPLYRLPALKMTIYHALVKPLVVCFGVHDQLPLVFIQEFKMFQ